MSSDLRSESQHAEEGAALHAGIAESEATLRALQKKGANAPAEGEAGERAGMEAALRASEARFRALANAIPTIVWTAAPDGTITYANDEWFRYVGLTPEQNAREWPELVLHPDDYERCMTQWTQALQQGTPYEIEVRNRRYDGQYRWFLTRAVPVHDSQGRVAAWYGTTTDLHERKQLEQALRESEIEYRALFELAGVGNAQVDVGTGRIRRVNRKLCEMLGYSEAELCGRTLAQITHSADQANTLECFRQMEQGQLTACSTEARYIHKEGSLCWGQLDVTQVPDAAGRPLYIIANILDITKRKRVEAEARFLASLSNELIGLTEPDDIIQAFTQRLGHYLEVQHCFIDEVDAPANQLVIRGEYHAGAPVLRGAYPLAMFPAGVLDELRAGQVVIVEDTRADPRVADVDSTLYAPAGIRSFVAIPRLRGGHWAASLYIAGAHARTWSDDVIALFRSAADRAWLAVENARLFQAAHAARQRAERAADRIFRLQVVTAALSKALTQEQVTDVILQQGLVALDAIAGEVVLRRALTGAALDAAKSVGYPEAMAEALRQLAPDTPLPIADVLRTGQPLWLESVDALDLHYPHLVDLYTSWGLEALAVVPLTLGETILGAAAFHFVGKRAFGRDDRTLFLTLAAQCAQALERARPYEVEQQARVAADASARAWAFLAEASQALARSLNLEATLQAAAEMAIPYLADFGLLHTFEPEAASNVAFAHRDPAKAALVQEFARRLQSASADLDGPIDQVQKTGQSALIPEWNEAAFPQLSAETQAAAQELGLCSLMLLPLTIRGATVGVLVLGAAESGRRYHQYELALGEELARRAALAAENARLYQAERESRQHAERSASRVERLQTVTAALARTLTSSQVIEVIMQESMAAIGAVAGTLSLLTEDGAILGVVRAVGYPEEIITTSERYLVTDSFPSTDAARTGEPLWFESFMDLVARYPHLASIQKTLKYQALAAIPLKIEGRTLGALGLGFAEARAFSREDQDLMLALVGQCAQALERARLHEAERRSHAEAEAARDKAAFLATLSTNLAASLDYEHTLQAAGQSVVPDFADWCMVDLLAEGAITRRALAVAQPEKEALLRELQAHYPVDPNGPHIVAQVIRTGQSLLLPELPASFMDQIARDERHAEVLHQLKPHSWMVVPLRVRGQILGAFSFVFTKPKRYDPDDLHLGEEIGWRVGTALDNARLYKAEQEARAAADAAARASAFMAEASQTLSHSLDYEATLQTLAALAVPFLANVSVVYGYDGREVRGTACAYADAAHAAWVKEAVQLYHPRPENSRSPVAQVLRTGESLLISDMAGSQLNLAPPTVQKLVRELDVRAAMIVPLRVREHIAGALVLLSAGPDRCYGASDLALAEELARRAALAAENARLYAEAQAWSAELETRVRASTDELAQSHLQLQHLSMHMERLREEERARIAREVHDELGGALTGLKMALVPLRKGHAGSDPELAMRINDMTALIDSTIQTVRRIASDLRPAILDEFGLLAALEWQAHEFQKRTGIVCHFNLNTDEPTLELDRESTTAIFRVFQESLTNIARHAHATEVTATLERQADSLSLSVHDNGQGIRLGELNNLKSLGLVGMRERMRQVAGALDIRSAPGQGTTVLIRIPLIKPEPVG